MHKLLWKMERAAWLQQNKARLAHGKSKSVCGWINYKAQTAKCAAVRFVRRSLNSYGKGE